MTLIFYSAAGSCSLASQIALEEAGADYQVRRLALANGEQREAAFLAVNPLGRVPALVVEGTAVTETIALLTFVASRYADARLLPVDDSLLLAKAYQRMSWYASSLHVAIAQIFRTERFTSHEDAWAAIKEGGRHIIEKGFDEIEAAFVGDWVLGERYSLVDGYTYVFRRWGERLGLDMAGRFPRWDAHCKRLLARPAVQRALAIEAGELEAPLRAAE